MFIKMKFLVIFNYFCIFIFKNIAILSIYKNIELILYMLLNILNKV